jgi:glycosyltransferase involved in cell wall biosynthesis
MKLISFIGAMSLGGTEKAACRWAWGLKERGHGISVLTLADGPRRHELEQHNIPVRTVGISADEVAAVMQEIGPDVIHAHAPGHPHIGDMLGDVLKLLPKIPVVQTNVFGHLFNPPEDAWTDFRLFISWTSCVQAARRVFRRLDEDFFRRASVAVYPLDPLEPSPAETIRAFRKKHQVTEDEVLFGRLGRPDLGKWSSLALDAFRLALRRNRKIKLLLREPPPEIAAQLRASPDAGRFVILPATSDAEELRLTLSALDTVLHTARNGESFGYGIAEPMNLGKPVITHSVPGQDQAQLELARHGECGFVASTPETMAKAILKLADDSALRERMGQAAQKHIRTLADPGTSVGRLERVLQAAIEKRDNPFAAEDLRRAKETAAYLDAHQFGHSLIEQMALRPTYCRARFHEWRKHFRFAHRRSVR